MTPVGPVTVTDAQLLLLLDHKDQDKDKDLTHKDKDLTPKDQDKDKDLKYVLKESLRKRTRTRNNITVGIASLLVGYSVLHSFSSFYFISLSSYM